MTNEELATYLNAELSMTGATAVTANVIRQWVLWDVLPRSSGRGRGYARGLEWRRDERDLRRAGRLADWRAAGIKGEQALIVHAFVAWGYRDWERVRAALLAEMERSAALIRKRVSSDLSFVAFADVGATRKRAYRKQLGPLDDRLAETRFQLSPELYAVVAQAMLQADFSRERLLQLLADKIAVLAPDLPQTGSFSPALLLKANIGLFASPDETDRSTIATVENCSERDLRNARAWLRKLHSSIILNRIPPEIAGTQSDLFAVLHSLGPQITTGHWLIAGLAAMLNLVNDK